MQQIPSVRKAEINKLCLETKIAFYEKDFHIRFRTNSTSDKKWKEIYKRIEKADNAVQQKLKISGSYVVSQTCNLILSKVKS